MAIESRSSGLPTSSVTLETACAATKTTRFGGISHAPNIMATISKSKSSAQTPSTINFLPICISTHVNSLTNIFSVLILPSDHGVNKRRLSPCSNETLSFPNVLPGFFVMVIFLRWIDLPFVGEAVIFTNIWPRFVVLEILILWEGSSVRR